VPCRLVHEMFDILMFGEGRSHLHRKKDRAWKKLGPMHRKVDHPLYQEYPKLEDLLDAMERREYKSIFKGKDRETESHVSHEVLDSFWDTLSLEDRREFAKWLLHYFIVDPHQAWLAPWGVDPSLGLVRKKGKREDIQEYLEEIEKDPDIKLITREENTIAVFNRRLLSEFRGLKQILPKDLSDKSIDSLF